MAENRNINQGGGNTFLAFVLGAIVIAVGIIAYFLFADGDRDVDVSIDTPQVTTPVPESAPGGSGGAPAGGGQATGGGTQGGGGQGGGQQ